MSKGPLLNTAHIASLESQSIAIISDRPKDPDLLNIFTGLYQLVDEVLFSKAKGKDKSKMEKSIM